MAVVEEPGKLLLLECSRNILGYNRKDETKPKKKIPTWRSGEMLPRQQEKLKAMSYNTNKLLF